MTDLCFPNVLGPELRLDTLRLDALAGEVTASVSVNFNLAREPGETMDVIPAVSLCGEGNPSKWLYQGNGIATRSFTEK